jgi:hypothetical protein
MAIIADSSSTPYLRERAIEMIREAGMNSGDREIHHVFLKRAIALLALAGCKEKEAAGIKELKKPSKLRKGYSVTWMMTNGESKSKAFTTQDKAEAFGKELLKDSDVRNGVNLFVHEGGEQKKINTFSNDPGI